MAIGPPLPAPRRTVSRGCVAVVTRKAGDDALALAHAYDAARVAYWLALLSFGERWPDITPTLQDLLVVDAGSAPRDELQLREILRSADADFALSADLPGAKLERRACIDARNALVEGNLGLVATMAKRAAGSFGGRAGLDDLFQEGAIGLMRACDTFNPARGFRFSTYSAWWIRKYIVDEAATSSLLRVPQKGFAAVFAMARAAEAFAHEHGRRPDDGELGELLDVGSRGLASIRSAAAAIRPVVDAGGGDSPIDAVGLERSCYSPTLPERPDHALERRQVAAVVVEVVEAVGDEGGRLIEARAGLSSWLRVRPALRADKARQAAILDHARALLDARGAL